MKHFWKKNSANYHYENGCSENNKLLHFLAQHSSRFKSKTKRGKKGKYKRNKNKDSKKNKKKYITNEVILIMSIN